MAARCRRGSPRAPLAAIGGSTNAIIHLCAVAGRRGITLPLSSFAAAALAVPVIADIAPIGTGLMPDLAAGGGVPAVLSALDGGAVRWPLRPVDEPVTSLPAFLVVRGNLAPDGAVIKAAAARRIRIYHHLAKGVELLWVFTPPNWGGKYPRRSGSAASWDRVCDQLRVAAALG